MEQYTSSYDSLIARLDEFIRKFYKNRLIKGVIYSTALLLAFYLTVTLLEYYAHFNTGMRTFLFIAFTLSNLLLIGRYIIDPLLRMNKLGKVISHEQASAIIGTHFSEVKDKLINVLQLKKESESGPPHTGNSQQLLLASIEQKTKELKPVPFTSAIDLSQNRRYLKYALVPLCLFVFILFSAPSMLTDSTSRLMQFNTYFEREAPFQFVVLNKELKAVQQEDFEVKVKLTGTEIPDNIFILVGDNEYKLDKENIINFNYVFKNLQKTTAFRFSADGFTSREFTLEALPNPLLLDFDIELNYPKYLGKKDEVIKNTGDLVVPAGTKVSWKFNTQNTDRVRMSFSDTAFMLEPSQENLYTFTQRLMKDKSYSVTTANSFMKSKDSVVYAINVIPDMYPGIQVEEKKDSVLTKRLYFNGQVKDDYGFSRLTFNYRFINENDSVKRTDTKMKSESIPVSHSLTQDQFYHFWDLSELGIQPGDQIEYYFEISDNDGVNGAKSTRSEKMLYKAPTLRELSDKTEEQNSEMKKDLQDAIKDSKDIQKQIADLNKKLLEKQSLTWEEKKKMQDLLDKQKDLQKKVEQMKNDNMKNNQQQEEYQKNSENIQDKQKQLEELFNQVMNEDMKKKYEELQKLLEQMDKEKMKDELDKMKMDSKDLEKELDRQLEMFKQLDYEQKLEDVTKNLEDLSKKQDDLSKESQKKDADNKDLEKKQEQLNKEMENIRKDMDELNKKNQELEKPNELPQTDKQEEQIQKEQEESSKQLEQNNKKNASKSQKSAAQQMQAMAQAMAQSQKENQKENAEEDINALRQILSNLVQLSFDQEALMGQFEKTRTENPQYIKLIQQQNKLKDDSKIIEDSLLALSKRVFQLQSIINKEITSINYNMDKAIDNYVDAEAENIEGMRKQELSLGSTNQRYAMTSMNDLALMLSEALQQMQDQARSSIPGMGSCNKPGGKGSPKPSAGNMKKMQEQLNKQIEALKKSMEEGGKKDGKKGKDGQTGIGSGGQGGMSEQLVKLAAQQEALRKMMQDLMNQTGGDGAGDMKNTLKDMEQTETELVNKMITQETMKRQQEILTKLLDYEKAEKEREQDNKRESKDGKIVDNRNQNQFLEYNKQKQKEAELLKTLPPSLTPYYKNKVNEYFNNFEK
jgi:hypothetical protein